jgi:predicted DNA-binding transcriptional regulator YafY
VEPIGLLYYSSAWHLIAWCRLRKGYRDFRLSRMLGVSLKEECFDRSSHPSVQEYIQQNRGSEELQEIIVSFDKKVVRYLGQQKYLNGFVSEEDLGDCVSMKFLTSSVEYFGRWLLMYGNTVSIESPAALRTLMKELSERLLAHHGAY